MIDSSDAPHMLDVIGHLGDSDLGSRMRLDPILEGRLGAIGLTDIDARKGWAVVACPLGGVVRIPAIAGGGDVARVEVDHHDSAVFLKQAQHVIRHVARVIDDRARRGMREHHRGFRGLEHRVHGLR